jgi:glycosyltransferase involved in cell wall biosynthesis
MDAANSFGGPTSVALTLLDEGGGLRPALLISAYARGIGPYAGPVPTAHRQFPGWTLRRGKPGAVLSLRFAASLVGATLTARAVVVHGLREPHSALAALLAVVTGRPFAVLAHGMLTGALASPSVYTRCCLALASRAAAVYALTEDEKVALSSWIDDGRLSVLPNAVPAREAPAAHAKYDVVVVSRLHRRKGIALASDVVRALLSRSPSCQVAIAGADEGELPHVAALVAEFPDSVHYLGGLSLDAARECIADAKVLLAVATEEPYGLTVVEAFREGTAVVMGTGGYALEEAWASAGAVLTAPRLGVALAEEVQGLLHDPRRRGQVADAGRRWAREHAGVESMAGEIRAALSADRTRSKAG